LGGKNSKETRNLPLTPCLEGVFMAGSAFVAGAQQGLSILCIFCDLTGWKRYGTGQSYGALINSLQSYAKMYGVPVKR
jgi:hypothetical protein